MSALTLENLLPDFGKRAARASDRGTDPAALAALLSARSEPELTHEMLEAEVASAEAAIRSRMTAEHEAAMELEAQRHASELAGLNALLGGQAAATIANRLNEIEDTVATLVTSATARILAVHLTAEVQRRMIDSLGEAVRDALQDSETVRIRVRGPLSLYEALADSIGELSRHLEFTETPGFDLSANIDGSLFETRLSDWSAALAEALA